VASGFQPDFPGQLQAQVIGVVALTLWGFVSGLVVCAPLGLLFHNLQRSDQATQAALHATSAAPLIEPDLSKTEVAQPSRSFR
jgi:Amt family ammonium transporter